MLHVQGPSGLQEGAGARSQLPVAAAEDSWWDQLGFTYPVPFLAGEARTPLTTGMSPCRKCQCPSQGKPRPTHSGVTPGNTRAGVPCAPSPAHCCQGRPPQHSRVLAGHCALITSEQQLLSWMLRCSGPHEPPDTELQRKLSLLLLHSPSKSNCFGNESVVWIFAVFLLKRVRRKALSNNFSTSLTEHN